MRIAIVGAGAVGVSLLNELDQLKKNFNHLEILIFDGTPTKGTGLPYQEDDDAIRLNLIPEKMSISNHDKDEFIHWLKEKGIDEDPSGKYFSRNIYGSYLKEVYSQLIEKTQAQVIDQSVVDIDLNKDGSYSLTTSKETYQVDSVQLAIGHLAYSDFYQLTGEKNYFQVPYPMEGRIPKFKKDDRVAILGTGLTSIDLMFYAKKYQSDLAIDFLSLEKSFAAVRQLIDDIDLKYLTPDHVEGLIAKKELTLDTFIDLFDKELAANGLNLKNMWNDFGQGSFENMEKDLNNLDKLGIIQSIINQNKKYMSHIWNQWSKEDKNQYLKDYDDQFLNYRATLPQSVAKSLITNHNEGQLEIFINIDKIKKFGDQFKVTFKDSDQVFYYDYILNGTGQDVDLTGPTTNQQDLIQNLIDKEFALAYEYGGILISYPDMSLIHPKHGKLDLFKVYGQLASGIDIFNNTIEKLKVSAALGIKDLTKQLNHTGTSS